MKDHFCSFKLTKLLDKAGFIPSFECIIATYNENGDNVRLDDEKAEHFYQSPTHQVALEWLRDEHNLLVMIEPLNCISEHKLGYHVCIYKINEWVDYLNEFKHVGLAQVFYDYHKAVEKAIEYSVTKIITK